MNYLMMLRNITFYTAHYNDYPLGQALLVRMLTLHYVLADTSNA